MIYYIDVYTDVINHITRNYIISLSTSYVNKQKEREKERKEE